MIDDPSTSFAARIREQADAHHATMGDHIEQVAARVCRAVGFANAGTSASGHRVAVDEPEQFGGSGTAPDPAELLLIAVGASLSVTLTVHAALTDIDLADVAVGLAGTLDADRFFDPSPAPGGGFVTLSVTVTLTTRAPRPAVQALLDRALQASPVLRALTTDPIVDLHIQEA